MPRNVVCLTIDRLRAAAVGAYGAALCETPAFDHLASASFLCDQAHVDALDGDRIVASLWRGVAAPRASLVEIPTLPARASVAGWQTVLLTDDADVAEHPLASDFDQVIRLPAARAEAAPSIAQTGLARFAAEAVSWLDEAEQAAEQNDAPPFLLWLHARGLAGPWDAPHALRAELADPEDPPPPDFVEVPARRLPDDVDPDEPLGLAQSYAAQVTVLDECLGPLVERLDVSRFGPSTLLAVLGARGFPLGEHGGVGSADEALHGESLQVPWLLRFPDGTGRLARTSALVTPADLAPTIADWLELAPLDATDGCSLLPLARGEASPTREAVVIVADAERAIRTADWHLRITADGATALYLKPDDRWEANEVSDRCPEIVAGLTALLDRAADNLAAGRPADVPPLDEALGGG